MRPRQQLVAPHRRPSLCVVANASVNHRTSRLDSFRRHFLYGLTGRHSLPPFLAADLTLNKRSDRYEWLAAAALPSDTPLYLGKIKTLLPKGSNPVKRYSTARPATNSRPRRALPAASSPCLRNGTPSRARPGNLPWGELSPVAARGPSPDRDGSSGAGAGAASFATA